MSLTLLQARTRLRDRLDEETATFWTDARLNTWINEGVTDLSRRAETVLVSAQFNPVIPGVNIVPCPPDLLRIYRVEWESANSDDIKALEYRDFNNMDEVWWESQESSMGEPWTYTTKGYPPQLSIVLYPTPSDSANLRIHYYSTPIETVNDNAPLPVQAGWEDLVVDYAEFRALRTDRNPEWQTAFQLYEANVVRLMERSRRYVEAAGQISSPVSGNLPAWLAQGGW
jgi:hypothetical protein